MACNFDDPLMSALVFFGKLHARPVNTEGAIQGLPVVNGALTPQLFSLAASRCGFESKIVERSIRQLHSATLPVILLMEGNEAVILTARLNKKEGEVVVLSSGNGTQRVALKDLEASYSGIAIMVKPSYQFERRADFNGKALGKNWFWGTLWKFRGFYVRVAAAAVITNLLGLASSMFVMLVYNRVVPNQAVDTLYVLATGVLIVYIFEFLLKNLRTFFVDRAGHRIDLILGSEIYSRILGMRFGDKPASAGSLASQARAYESLREFFTSGTVAALVDLPFIYLFVFVIFLLGGGMVALPIICGIFLALLVGGLMQIPISRAVARSYYSGNQRQALFVEGIQALETIKSTRSESQMQARMEETVQMSARAEGKARSYTALAMSLTALVQHLVSTAMIIFAFYEVMQEKMTMGAMIACVILTGRAMAPMGVVASLMARLQQSRRSLKGLNQIMSMPMEREERGAQYIHLEDFRPEISTSDLLFTYEEQGSAVINGVSVSVKPGERVALLGKIGSGKSSLLRLLMGFHAPKEGRIDISGIDLRQLDPAELRRHIGYVPQEPNLLYGTLRTNLKAGCPWVSDQAMLNALDRVGLADFIRTLPRGIDQAVNEGGKSLSGGQRQSIAVARALIEEPELLLLDEPTSAIDTRTERHLLSGLDAYLKEDPKRTLLIATHKRSVLSMVDRVIVLGEGRVLADGSKSDVLKKTRTASPVSGADQAAAPPLDRSFNPREHPGRVELLS